MSAYITLGQRLLSLIRSKPELVKRTFDSARNGESLRRRFVASIKDDPVGATLTAIQVGLIGAQTPEILEELKKVSPGVWAMISDEQGSLKVATIDAISAETPVADLSKFTDELEDITAAIRHFGGVERALRVRRAMAMPMENWLLHRQVAEVSKKV